MPKVEDFQSIQIKLASPQDILSWSHGEVLKPETINYRTQKPEKDGLFDERIFGPTKDYECYCGKYKRIRYKGVVCDKCGVEVTKSSVRRERMGHITLEAPVAHIWFLKGVPSRLALLLDVSKAKLERVVYYIAYILEGVDEGERKQFLNDLEKNFRQKISEANGAEAKEEITAIYARTKNEVNSLKEYQILEEIEYQELSLKYGHLFKASTGSEALRRIIGRVNLKALDKDLTEKLESASKDKRKRLQARLRLVRSLIRSGIKAENMFISVLPVLPPDLRPMVQLDGGKYASSDLNDLYRRIINRNNRLKYLSEIGSPEVIIRNEKRMLQEAVDSLLDNSMKEGTQKKQRAQATGQHELKSLADILKGKEGRFRQNLLGKRVDYSARSVIAGGPYLKLDEVGIPKTMALEIFKPFVIHEMIGRDLARNVKHAGRLIQQGEEEVWDILDEVIANKYVLLNRAPTLHRLSIQAFKPILIEGQAIRLHPLTCPAFNADFDGDQMAVFLPLTDNAQAEAKNLMLSSRGILKPATSQPIALPRQDMVLGLYYLTIIKEGAQGEGKTFATSEEALYFCSEKEVNLQAKIKVRLEGEIIETTCGRLIFNKVLPKGYGFVNSVVDAKKIKEIVSRCIEVYGIDNTAPILDALKTLGFEYATLSGITWSMFDLTVPVEKEKLVNAAQKEEEEIKESFRMGFLNEEERKIKIVEIWQRTKDQIAKLMPKTLAKDNPIYQIIDSGSRGSWSQPTQMAGMKGVVVNPAGDAMELPVKNSYKEGLSVLEYFISTHGARKGTADTALRTSNAGYLTRRLIDATQEVIVRTDDCGDKKGIIADIKLALKKNQDIEMILFGRTAAENVVVEGGKVLVKQGEIITHKDIDEIITYAKTIDKYSFRIFSPFSCKLVDGVCQKCYGLDLATRKPISLGTCVGIIAAQSIGEPGTQLTLRTFHSGGVMGASDITRGLPRVEELFSARHPKGWVPIAEFGDEAIKAIKEIKKHPISDEDFSSAIDLINKEGNGEINVIVTSDDDSGQAYRTVTTKSYNETKKRYEKFEEDFVKAKKAYDANKGGKRADAVKKKFDEVKTIFELAKKGFEVGFDNAERDFDKAKKDLDAAKKAIEKAEEKKAKEDAEKKFRTIAEKYGELEQILIAARTKKDFESSRDKIEEKIFKEKEFIPWWLVFTLDKENNKLTVYRAQRECPPREEIINTKKGFMLEKGARMFEGGSLDQRAVLRLRGDNGALEYTRDESLSVYVGEGVPVHNKHLEIVIRQMLSRLKIVASGESIFTPGQVVSKSLYERECERLKKENKKLPKVRQIIVNIADLPSTTDSFLAAASFQETSRVLVQASIESKEDHLRGLKENVILGKLIPAGTNYKSSLDDKTKK